MPLEGGTASSGSEKMSALRTLGREVGQVDGRRADHHPAVRSDRSPVLPACEHGGGRAGGGAGGAAAAAAAGGGAAAGGEERKGVKIGGGQSGREEEQRDTA